jgi:hypothetical protein
MSEQLPWVAGADGGKDGNPKVEPPICREAPSEATASPKWAAWAPVATTGEPICPERQACAGHPLTPQAQWQMGGSCVESLPDALGKIIVFRTREGRPKVNPPN